MLQVSLFALHVALQYPSDVLWHAWPVQRCWPACPVQRCCIGPIRCGQLEKQKRTWYCSPTPTCMQHGPPFAGQNIQLSALTSQVTTVGLNCRFGIAATTFPKSRGSSYHRLDPQVKLSGPQILSCAWTIPLRRDSNCGTVPGLQTSTACSACSPTAETAASSWQLSLTDAWTSLQELRTTAGKCSSGTAATPYLVAAEITSDGLPAQASTANGELGRPGVLAR
mmetsp:Transcript_117394/g.228251  ORF Transcript_117394/g.228251 Transcript_117394/m.228251 type:complete len:224 (-) Transcript_117394:365-1036(-)